MIYEPKIGEKINNGGARYICVGYENGCPILISPVTGWTMTVHGLVSAGGSFVWDYSTNGHFRDIKP